MTYKSKKLLKYLETDWFIILFIVSMFVGNAIIFSIFPGLNNLPTWLLYIALFLGGSLFSIVGLLLILFIDIKIDNRRFLKEEYKRDKNIGKN